MLTGVCGASSSYVPRYESCDDYSLTTWIESDLSDTSETLGVDGSCICSLIGVVSNIPPID
jgi:hypothetical protein